MALVEQGHEPRQEAMHRLIDEYRTRCLWFLRSDYYPRTLEEQLRVLRYIGRYGDREVFVRAAEIRQWLSPSSSAPSAAFSPPTA